MHNLKHLRFSNLRFFFAFIIIIFYSSTFANSYSLYKTLDYYGYSNDSQKKALENLMQYAGILSPNQSFEDYYPIKNSYDGLLRDILSFIQQTQKHFILRTGKLERWETKIADWMEQNKEKILENAKELGVVNEIIPTQRETDAICILGSTFGSMRKRLNYFENSINIGKLTAKNLILLAGERKVTIGVDGDEASLLEIAKKYDIDDLSKLTETHLIKTIYENSGLYNKLQTFVIDTPAGDLPRPTTETTVNELVKWLSTHPEIKRIVFISNQPYIKYQEAVITQILKRSSPHIIFEVVGPEVGEEIKALKLVEGIGSYIWAKTPSIVSQLGKVMANEELLQEFKKLYGNNVLMYSDIESLFRGN